MSRYQYCALCSPVIPGVVSRYMAYGVWIGRDFVRAAAGRGTINVPRRLRPCSIRATSYRLRFHPGISASRGEFGLPEYPPRGVPVRVGFRGFTSTGGSGSESGDGSVSFRWRAAELYDGDVPSAGYGGAVSVLDGSLQLSEALSQQLFGSSAAVLTLLNTGPAVTVDCHYTLQQDMTVSLEGGGLSVGAPLAGRPDGLAGPSRPPDLRRAGTRFGRAATRGGALLCALSMLRGQSLRVVLGTLKGDSYKLAACSHASL